MASKRRRRRKACQGKQRHPDKQSASQHWYALWKKDGEKMRVYKCPHCHGWHVGHRGGIR
jgi:hypothetical protein